MKEKNNLNKRKKILYCLPFILFAVLINSCNMSDYKEDLIGGYTFVSDGKNNNKINGKNIIYPNVVEYEYNDDFILVCQIPNQSSYKSLLAINLWSNYFTYNSYLTDSLSEKYYKSRNEILADSIISKIFKDKQVTYEYTFEDRKKSEEITDSIIKNDPIHKKVFSLKKVYWIIKVKEDIRFGPYNKEEFLSQKDSLLVGKKLKLLN